MILLATAATVIASQAVITGAFSVASQAAQLGYLPRLRIAHTSESTIGQIYVPWVNWMLAVAVLTLVFAFRSSAALAYAFGMAVVTTITITTLLFFYLARVHWRTPLWLVVLGGGCLLVVDLLFLAANLTKLAHGAWLPLLIGLIAYAVMTTWLVRPRSWAAFPRDPTTGSPSSTSSPTRAIEANLAPVARPTRGCTFVRGDICDAGAGRRGDGRPRRGRPLRRRVARGPLDRRRRRRSSPPTCSAPRCCWTRPCAHGVGRFVHVSTDEVYGSIDEGSWTEELAAGAELAVLGVEGRLRPAGAGLPPHPRHGRGRHPLLQQLRARTSSRRRSSRCS